MIELPSLPGHKQAEKVVLSKLPAISKYRQADL
jgi:hypothetical protein